MEFKKQYLEGIKDSEKKGFYSFRKFLPKTLQEKNSRKHLELFLSKRWSYIPRCQKVLDIGCGIGNFIKFNPKKVELWGLDIIKENIDDLKRQGLKVKQGDVNKKIPFAANSFDCVTCFHVFEHLADPSNAISEIKRVLKDQGTVVIAVPNLSFAEFYNDYTHVKPWTRISLFKFLKDNGFVNIKIKKGSYVNPIISGLFFLSPKIRFMVEELFGKISPFEITAVAKNKKDI